MRVRVLFFGRLKELAGCTEDWAELPSGATVEELFSAYAGRTKEMGAFRPSLAAAVNEDLAKWDTPLKEGDEVAFLPPVSGGSTSNTGLRAARDVIALVRAPIRHADYQALAKSPHDGAVVVFDGIVRNNTKGRSTLYLEYEAYQPMALRQMREIAAEMRRRFPVDGIALVHRLGRLEIGETSVLIVVSSPHRAAAFDACRFAIETVKRSVPIWKKEYYADGEVWVEGASAEPVPKDATKPFPASSESIP